jgi:hypothetical protein
MRKATHFVATSVRRVFVKHFNHSIDYHEQGIIGKLVAVPSISNDNFNLICIYSGGNLRMKNMTPLLIVLTALHFLPLRSP